MSRRTDRIARSLQVHLAELVNYRLADPRIDRMVTISAVEVSADLRHARVRVTALNADDAHLRKLRAALQHASGRLRSMVGERMDLRAVPRLEFHIDEQAIHARRTLEAIGEAMRQTPPPPDPQDPDRTVPDGDDGGGPRGGAAEPMENSGP